MNFSLSNTHRKYMGIKELKVGYELVKIKKGEYEEFYVYFDKEKIVKIIHYVISPSYISMFERDVNYVTKDNRKIILPKTSRGKERKITGSVIESLEGEGAYLTLYKNLDDHYGHVLIGNFTTQKSFYEDNYVKGLNSLDDIKEWCDNFVLESTDDDLKEVKKFSKEKRKHIDYQEGDYFRIKCGRKYTYGRILLDVYKKQKEGFKYWNILMGKPLVVEIFHILTDRKDVTVEELEKLDTFPSQHILNNNLYYGDYEIIGHKEIPDMVKYPIMYGKSIFAFDGNEIIFQCGEIYKEIPYTGDNLIKREELDPIDGFKNNGIRYSVDINPLIIKKCIEEKSNNPYWEYYSSHAKHDLRSPENREYLKRVLKQFDLEFLLDIYV